MDSPYKYLNAGTYISYVGTLKRIFEKINFDIHSEFEKFDDQRVCTDIYLQNENLIVTAIAPMRADALDAIRKKLRA